MTCPRCREAVVRTWRTEDGSLSFQMCEDCEATWDLKADPASVLFTQLPDFLSARGKRADVRLVPARRSHDVRVASGKSRT